MVIFKLSYNTIILNASLKEKATSLWNRSFPLVAPRGIIYDTNNNPLVYNEPVLSLYACPKQIVNKKKTSEILSNLLSCSKEKILAKINKNVSIISIHPEGKKLSYELALKIQKENMEGIFLVQDYKREYPYSPYLSNLLGFVGIDNLGLAGLENYYDNYLLGINGTLDYMMDGKGGLFSNKYYTINSPKSGLSLKLTLNLEIQNVIEREINNARINYNPSEISCLAMDPRNGEILAIACYPNYDNNNYSSFEESTYNRLLPVYNSFEPGSTFKAISFAAAIEEKLIDIDHDYYYDKGYEIVSGRRIKSWKKGGHGLQTYLEVLQNSSNPGFVQISRLLGGQRLYSYVEKFGFLEKTGVDIQGENKGVFFKKDDFKELECATTSFGQGISCTAIQLVSAFSSIINGGILYTPHILKEVITPFNETVYQVSPSYKRRTISEETSSTMRRALECVVAKGSGRKAFIEGYRIGGKTGTAQIAEGGAYKDGQYILSFIVGAPMSSPRIVLYFSMKEAHNCIQYGGTTIGPIIKNIMNDVLPILNVKKDYSGEEKIYTWMDEKYIQVPNFIGCNKKDVKSSSFSFSFLGSGEKVIDQLPRVGERIQEGSTIMIQLGN